MTRSHNFSYCVSEYIINRYNQFIDERICYIIGCAFGLRLLPVYNCFKLNPNTNFFDLDLKDYFIETVNPHALEYFTTNIRAMFRPENDDNIADIKWIASDYQTLEGKKTLISISNSIFDVESIKGHQPVYSLSYIADDVDLDFSIGSLKNCTIDLQFSKDVSLNIEVEHFFKFWQIDGLEVFNANRFVIVPPVFKDFESVIHKIIYTALKLNYFKAINETSFSGSTLIKKLHENLIKDNSHKILGDHIEFLRYSLMKNSILGKGDMDKSYIADSFKFLTESGYLDCSNLVRVAEANSDCWKNVLNTILYTDLISTNELSDIYLTVLNQELKFENELKKALKL
jgi:hypothetical protein